MSVAQASGEAPRRGTKVRPFEWEGQRPRITSLYEHHTVAQVRRIMEREHNFRATIRMFRAHLSAWGCDKKSKASEMEAIAREARRHREQGNGAVFFVRGRAITYNTVQSYYRRRGMTMDQVLAQAEQNYIHGEHKAFVEIVCDFDEAMPSSTPESASSLPAPQPQTAPICRCLDAPAESMRLQQAIRAMDVYIRGSFDSAAWSSTTATHQFTAKPHSSRATPCMLYGLMNQLYSQARLACDLFTEKRYAEGGVFLRSSMQGIKEITAAAYPPLPAFLPQTLRSITTRQAPEVAYAMLKQFASFALDFHGAHHPIYQLCSLLYSVDTEMLPHAVTSLVTAVNDTFRDKLGPMHRTTLSARYTTVFNRPNRGVTPELISGVRGIVDDCMSALGPDDTRTTVFRLHLAGWLLRLQSTPKDRTEALNIMADAQSLAAESKLDKEASVLLLQAQIAAAECQSVVDEAWRESAMDCQLNMTSQCLGCSCDYQNDCLVGKLFWPSSKLWESRATLFGEPDGSLIRHFRELRRPQTTMEQIDVKLNILDGKLTETD